MSSSTPKDRPLDFPRSLVPWLRRNFPIFGFCLAVFAAFYFWITVAYDGHLNASWWSFYQSSFSALGDPSASNAGSLAWFYNDVVVIPTGIMIMVFGASMIVGARNRVQITGSGFFMQAGVFLALIGVYHGGTAPHDFLSEWFFIWSAVAILTWGVGLVVERRALLGVLMILMVLLAVGLLAFIHFASVAETEAYGIVFIDLWLVLMYFGRKAVSRPTPEQFGVAA